VLFDDAYIDKLLHAKNYICEQSFNQSLSSASDLAVSYVYCQAKCADWTLITLISLSNWIFTLLQFILSMMIFSITISWSYKFEILIILFDFDIKKWTEIVKITLSFLVVFLIVTINTVFWVMTLLTEAELMLFNELYETLLNYKIIVYFNNCSRVHHQKLSIAQWVALLRVIVVDNLRLKIRDLKKIIKKTIIKELKIQNMMNLKSIIRNELSTETDATANATRICLLLILSSQLSFEFTVEASVLFYIEEFIYSCIELFKKLDNDELSCSLTLKTWWLIIVHVIIINECLLVSSNLSTTCAIFELRTQSLVRQEWLFWKSVYDFYFQSVSMWNRDFSKMIWLKHTTEWIVHDSWYNEMIHMHLKTQVIVIMITLVLMLILSVLVFFIAVMHSNSDFSCHALIILIYAELQLVLVFMIVWRDFHSFAVSSKQSRLWWRKTSTIIRDIVLDSFFPSSRLHLLCRNVVCRLWMFIETVFVTYQLIIDFILMKLSFHSPRILRTEEMQVMIELS